MLFALSDRVLIKDRVPHEMNIATNVLLLVPEFDVSTGLSLGGYKKWVFIVEIFELMMPRRHRAYQCLHRDA